ncbi:MAG: TolC family protein [Planctomycetota bacterium]|nr:TolC family protein [Planctomycetota bacterium]
MGRLIPYILCCFALLFALAGCVQPGRVEPSVLNRYQKTMARRGPQSRLSEQGIDSLRPAPGTTGPKWKIRKDPKTGKAIVEMTLDDAVMRALANNLQIRVVSFAPEISREEMVRAAAEFDYVLYGTISYTKEDRQTDSMLGGGESRVRVFEVGLRQRTITGAEWSLGWTLTRTWDNSTFRTFSSRYEPEIVLSVAQPLLRDAWPEFNLAQLRIARLNRKISVATFRQNVEEIVALVINSYWALVRSRRELKIQQGLLDTTIETLRRVRGRVDLDATAVEIKQAEAAVARRRSALYRQAKQIQDVQTALARLLADAEINVLGEVEIVPVTRPVVTKVKLDPTDQLLAALTHNAQLEQARLAISVADINVRVAANQKLPRLDLSASTTMHGLRKEYADSMHSLDSTEYVSYSVGLTFEYPIGNRQRIAEFRQAGLKRLEVIASWQDLADEIAFRINERIREVRTAYQEMQTEHVAYEAAKVQLQALEDTERIRGRLTPEFLQVKLSAQEFLAEAERAEVRAITSYNSAMADLARDTGTMLQMYGIQLVIPQVLYGRDWSQAPRKTAGRLPRTTQPHK